MDFKTLLEFIQKEDKRLIAAYGNDHVIRVFGRTIKLMEELGELCYKVLDDHACQRKKGERDHTKNAITEELADVLIVTLLLAQALDVDIEKGLAMKVKKVQKRSRS